MKTIIAPLAGCAVLALGISAASAASPAYCTLYAKAYVKQATLEGQGSMPADYVQSRAFHKCLNSDEEPMLPTAYAEPEADGAIGGPYVAIEEEGSATEGSEATAGAAQSATAAVTETAAVEAEPEAEPQAKPAAAQRSAGSGGSGLVAWSTEWKTWCKSHFPNSWDAKTGTVIPFETGKRELCR